MKRAAATLLLLACCAVGCTRPSSSSGSVNTDPPDANVVLDGGCTIMGLNCSQVGDCSEACGTDEACVERCQNAACGSATDLFAAVRSCTIENCWSRCLGGATPQCLECSAQQCASQQDACNQHSCPVTCTTVGMDGGVTMDASSVGDAGVPKKNCAGIYACMGTCLVETPFLCIGFCKTRGCTAAGDTLDELLQCADAQCDTATDDRCKDRYSTDQCQACLEERCSTAWAGCNQQVCSP